MSASPVTIVLPTYDRRHVLERTIGSYLELGRRHPLLVIDDGSGDGTTPWLRGLGVQVVRHSRRRGLTAARNTGLSLARSEWVLYGEDDVLMPTGHVEALLAWAMRLPRVGALTGNSFIVDGWTMPEEAPATRPTPVLELGQLMADFASAIPGPRLLPSLHARALIRRSAACAIGGYDETLTDSAFREESDFYARLWHSGWACWFVPGPWELHVRHRLGGGCRGRRGWLAKAMNRCSYWRNNARFVDRHRRLWARWGDIAQPGTLKARFAWEILKQAWLARR